MLNRVVLIGRLTKDPELRYSPTGVAVTNFTLAIDRKFKNAQGEKETDFIPCVAFKQLAELVSNYLSKGKMASVDGRMQVRTYNDKDGVKKWVTEVLAEDVHFLSPKDENSGAPAQNTQQQTQTQPQQQSYQAPHGQPPAQPYGAPSQYGQQPSQQQSYPGYSAPPGYTPQQGYSQPPQGQWLGQPPGTGQQPPPTGWGQPPLGNGQPPGQPPGQHPNMSNPNLPPNPPGAPATGLYGHQVNINLDDDIPF